MTVLSYLLWGGVVATLMLLLMYHGNYSQAEEEAPVVFIMAFGMVLIWPLVAIACFIVLAVCILALLASMVLTFLEP